ncbi:hypothetical protein JNB89_07350 [Paraburkholderia phenoliruptrix]|nr:hypothetical protein [Paraburkholderia phenoliruptrix]MBW9128666.1 hypothetical protein [Paraburkholderia ginsengiterrae]
MNFFPDDFHVNILSCILLTPRGDLSSGSRQARLEVADQLGDQFDDEPANEVGDEPGRDVAHEVAYQVAHHVARERARSLPKNNFAR